jgi:hypothetical protein
MKETNNKGILGFINEIAIFYFLSREIVADSRN